MKFLSRFDPMRLLSFMFLTIVFHAMDMKTSAVILLALLIESALVLFDEIGSVGSDASRENALAFVPYLHVMTSLLGVGLAEVLWVALQ